MASNSAGFLREADDSLTVTTDATGALYRDGFLRSPTGALVVTTSTAGATMQDGFLRAANGALVVVSGGAGTMIAGFLRDTNLALVVAASGGVGRVAGFSRDASLRLVVTGLAGGGFVPTDVAGLQLWLKADAGTSTTIDGAAISQWNDQSGNARHAAQATGANQPLYKAAIRNGKPVVRFDGVNDNLAFTVATLGANATVFVVQQTTGDCGLIGNTGAADSQVRIGNGGLNVLSMYSGGSLHDSPSTLAVARTSWTYLTYSLAAGTPTFYENGVSLGTSAATGSSFAPNEIGGLVGTANPVNGDIAEILVYDSVLSTANRQSVESYLASKYAL